jgi:hypothetical protein
MRPSRAAEVVATQHRAARHWPQGQYALITILRAFASRCTPCADRRDSCNSWVFDLSLLARRGYILGCRRQTGMVTNRDVQMRARIASLLIVLVAGVSHTGHLSAATKPPPTPPPVVAAPTVPKLVTISIDPAPASLPKGISYALKATGTYSDKTTVDVTQTVTWISSDPSIATVIKTTGVVTAIAVGGPTNITASDPKDPSVTSPAFALTVNGQPMSRTEIAPANISVAVQNSRPLSLRAYFQDGSNFEINATSWTSSPSTIASISSSGVVTGIASGQATITAKYGEVPATTTVTVVATEVSSTGLALGLGDQIRLDAFMRRFHDADVPDSIEFYAPPGTILRIDNVDRSRTNFFVHADCKKSLLFGSSGDPDKQTFAPSRAPEWTKQLTRITCATEYVVPADSFGVHGIQSAGNEYGILVIPYKFHLTDHSLSSGATVGAYAGFHVSEVSGQAVSLVLSAGIGNVTVVSPASAGKPASSTNEASFTTAAGAIVTLTKTGTFQIGLLVGVDFAGKSSAYPYESKPWVAVSFGANLTK